MTDTDPGPGATTHRTARNAVVRAVAEVLGKSATLVWTVIAARMLTTDEFGEIAYGLNLMLIITAVAAWGFDFGLIQKASARPGRLSALYQASQVSKTLLLVPIVAVALAFSWSDGETTAVVVLSLMLVAGFPESWSATVRSLAAARQRVDGIAATLVLQRVVTAVAVVGALLAGFGLVGVAGGFLLGTAIGWITHHRQARVLGARARLSELRVSRLIEASSGTFLIGLSGLVLMLLFRVDVVILGHLGTDHDVAVYSVAYRLLETVLFVTYAVNQAVLPVMSATDSTDRQRRGYEGALSIAGLVYLPFAIGALVEGRAVLDLLFGAQYAEEAAPVLAWLALAPLLFAAAFFGGSVLMARNHNRVLAVSSVVALAVNVVLNVVLIPEYAGVGAAAATTIAYGVQFVVVFVALVVAGARPRVLTPLATAGVAAIALTAVLVLLDTHILVEIAAGGVVYVGIWLVLVRRFAPAQDAVLRQFLRRS